MEQAQLLCRLQPKQASCSPRCSAANLLPSSKHRTGGRSGSGTSRGKLVTLCAQQTAVDRPKRKYDIPQIDPEAQRPWIGVIPTLDEMTGHDWFLRVSDWPTFWVMFQRWLEYESDTGPTPWEEQGMPASPALTQYLDPDHADLVAARTLFYEQWFGIRDREQVLAAIEAVELVVYYLELEGVPMPANITYVEPIGKYFKARRDRDPIYVTEVEEEAEPEPDWEYPEKPWKEWDDFGFRVHVEKVRQKEEQYEDFLHRMDQVGKYKHMEVTPETDARLAKHQPLYRPSVDMPHEEIMKVITKDGTCVDPNAVPVVIEDPKSIANIQGEVKWHPETEDFIKGLGRWVESEDDLPGLHDEDEETNEATMDEDFSDLGDAFEEPGDGEEADVGEVEEGETGGDAESVLGFGGEEDGTETAAMDSEFE